MMRFMKIVRKAAILFFLLTACMVLGACHGKTETIAFATPEEFDESRNYEITFWAKNDTNLTQTEIYSKTIGEFEKIYPNIHVNLRLYTDYGKIYNDVITNIATNTTPNVCITYPDHIATYMTGSNQVVPLDDLFADSKYGLGGSEVRFDSVKKEEIVPEFLSECYLNGYTYAIPYMRSTEACYVNKTFVEKLGYTLPETLTWDFVWEVSEKAMEKDANGNFKINGQKVMIPFIYKSTDNMMIQMLRQKNIGYSTANGEILMFNEDTRDLLFEIAEHAKSRAFSTFKISSYPGNFLNAGQCIFGIDSTAGATWMGSKAPHLDISKEDVVEFEMEVLPIPQYDPKHPQMISQGPSICVFNKEDPQEVLASWLFAQFMLTNEVQIAYSKTEGYVPVTLKAQSSAEYQDYLARCGEDNEEHYDIKIKATNLLLNNTQNTFVTPVFNGSTSLRDAAGQLIENTTKAVRRSQVVDDAFMEQQYVEVSALYRLDQIAMSSTTGKVQLGKMPTMSKVLIAVLLVTWILIGIYVVFCELKRRRNSQ